MTETLAQPFGPIVEGSLGAYIPETLYVQQGNKVWFVAGNTRTLNESLDEGTVVVESIDQLDIEERDGHKYVKDGRWYVEGTYQRSDVENANKRKYPRKIWERIIANPKSPFMQSVKAGGVVGHIEHPGDGRTDGNKVALKHIDFKLKEDGQVWGRSMITSNTPGRDLQALTADGVRWGVSSRGSGSIGSDGTVSESDFQLETFDMVMKPSTFGAYPTLAKANAVKDDKTESVVEGDDATSLGESVPDSIASILADPAFGRVAASMWVLLGAPAVIKAYENWKHNRSVIPEAIKKAKALTASGVKDVKVYDLNGKVVYGGDKDESADDAASLDEDAIDETKVPALNAWKMTRGLTLAGGNGSTRRFGPYTIMTAKGGGNELHFNGTKIGHYDSPQAAVNAAREHAKKQPTEQDELSPDAQACVDEAIALSETDVTRLDESESAALAVKMLKSFGRVNGLDGTSALPKSKANDLRDWLTRKLSEVQRRIVRTPAAPKVVTEGRTEGDGGNAGRDAVVRRVVEGLQQRITDANRDAAEQRELAEANQARAEAAEAALEREQKLREAAVEQVATVGERLATVTRQYDNALATIEELTEADVTDPVTAAVNEAVEQNPRLNQFRGLLERSDTPEEVFTHAARLAGTSGGGETGANGRTRSHAARPTLPAGALTESVVGPNNNRGTATVKASPGANAAIKALGRMKATVRT